MGLPLIYKAIYYTLAIGAQGETIRDIEDCAKKLKRVSESSWQPARSSASRARCRGCFSRVAALCFCFVSLFPKSPVVYILYFSVL